MDDKNAIINDVTDTKDHASGQVEDFGVNESALIRKIDWRIVPTLFLAYFLQFLDKVVINVSRVNLSKRGTSILMASSMPTLWVYKKIFT